jgi:hypothetical protein
MAVYLVLCPKRHRLAFVGVPQSGPSALALALQLQAGGLLSIESCSVKILVRHFFLVHVFRYFDFNIRLAYFSFRSKGLSNFCRGSSSLQ